MRRRPPNIPQRRVVFLGCEGASERGYAALLNEIARAQAMPLAIQAHPLNPGAGDPLELVRKAIQYMQAGRRRGGTYLHAAVLLDEDKCIESQERCAQARALAAVHGLQLIWQRPNHEALLLRHLDGCQNLNPAAGQSLGALQRRWQAYTKPMTARRLAVRIGRPEIQRASTVEIELREFLAVIGWRHG